MKNIFGLNLQLFAEAVVNTTDSGNANQNPVENGVQAYGGTGMTAETKTFYDKNLIAMAGPNLVYDQLAQKRPIPKGNGKSVEFRRFKPLPKATQPLTEGVTPAGKKVDVESMTSYVSQYGDYIVHSDLLELTAVDNVIVEDTRLLGNQAGITLDTIVRNKVMAGNVCFYCPKTVNGVKTQVTDRADLDETSTLTVDVIKRAVTYLRANNAPTFDGYYVAVIHPHISYDLMNDPAFVEASKYGAPEQLFKGEIGRIAGVRFLESSEAKIWNDPADDTPEGLAVYGTLIVGRDAYGSTEIEGGGLETIIKQKGSSGVADALDQRSSVGWKATKTAEVLVENYMVRIESTSSAFSDTAAN